jgi:hypothetical protein
LAAAEAASADRIRHPGWAENWTRWNFWTPGASRAAAHSAPGCLPGGLFENKQCRFPVKNISIVSNFAHTASARSHSINPALRNFLRASPILEDRIAALEKPAALGHSLAG